MFKGEGVSRTLECSYDDWCAWKMAEALGEKEDAAFFAKRAENWRNVFDAKSGFMRGRRSDGSWREPFDPYRCGHESSWGGDFTEGNAWQWRWHVLQDPAALVDALGGKAKTAALLDELFSLPSDLDKSHTSPDVTGLWGQYVQGNEPSHHIPYLYQYAGRPDRAAERIREICRRFYRNAPDGLCGNEDHGEMSAWYVFACLGFYPVNPSSGEFVIGAPQVACAKLKVESGEFRVVAKNLSRENKYVKSVTLNGKPLAERGASAAPVIRYADIMAGDELVFEMTGGMPR
jgi:predicted alpha-1,2-mannosidase